MPKNDALPDIPAACVSVEIADRLSPADINDLCDALIETIAAGDGFGWLRPPTAAVLERYWRGVMTMPERHLIVARLDGVICGGVQLVEPSRHNEAQRFAATIASTFVAPFARGQGAARRLMETAEHLAAEMGYAVLQLDVRETQSAARRLYDALGYTQWGIHPAYALVDNQLVRGYHYYKNIAPLNARAAQG